MLVSCLGSDVGTLESGDRRPDDGSGHLIKEWTGAFQKVADDELRGKEPATLAKTGLKKPTQMIDRHQLSPEFGTPNPQPRVSP